LNCKIETALFSKLFPAKNKLLFLAFYYKLNVLNIFYQVSSGDPPLTKDKTLHDLRRDIDEIDDRILDLLNQRASLVIKVGKLKSSERRDFYVPSREREIYERLTAKNKGPFSDKGLKSVFREIISASLALEAPMKVAFFGPKATFTHMAAM
jgi:chorismate mutase/prephenate dehydratase